MVKNLMQGLVLGSFILLHTSVCGAGPQAVLPLWSEGVPGNIVNQDMERRYSEDRKVGYVRVCIPTLEVYMPVQPQEAQQAVVVCPGGGYGGLAYSHEGLWIAEQLNHMGIVAAVLKYRLPDDRVMTERHKRPLQDAQRALQIMHEHASDWDIDPNQIGVMGFSAGGHLAATVSTHFRDVLVEEGTVEQVKPDFSILVYPVISMTEELTHQGSRNKLIGSDASETLIQYFSNEQQVSAEMSPVLLVHSFDDTVVVPGNSVAMFQALHAVGVPTELHIITSGGHGFGWRPGAATNSWFDWVKGFMASDALKKAKKVR